DPQQRVNRTDRPLPTNRAGPPASDFRGFIHTGVDFTAGVTESMRAATQKRERRQSEREQHLRERPLRRLRRRRIRQVVATTACGFVAFGTTIGLAAVVTSGTGSEVAPIVALGGVDAVALTGGVVFARRSRNTGKKIDQFEQHISSTSIAMPRSADDPITAERLPPTDSAAYPLIRRLRVQQRLLQQLLPDIERVATNVGQTAATSVRALEKLGQRIVLVESTIAESELTADELAGDFGGMQTSLDRLIGRLSDGVAAHERLVAGAASVVGELETLPAGNTATTSVREAADGLHALALGLNEVSNVGEPASSTSIAKPAVSLPKNYGAPRNSQPKRTRNPTEEAT
ncbi:MAG: hypothetical protein ABI137_00125, partial [Antricoccus sp.]